MSLNAHALWLLLGFGGQFFFSARFLVQWLMSERAGRSVLPIHFWYFSLVGGLLLFCYAIHKRDPVFILGQGMGLVVYLRNLQLVRRASADI